MWYLLDLIWKLVRFSEITSIFANKLAGLEGSPKRVPAFPGIVLPPSLHEKVGSIKRAPEWSWRMAQVAVPHGGMANHARCLPASVFVGYQRVGQAML